MNKSKNKLESYFALIERHILDPIEKGILKSSCFASLMLLFSAIDGLGKLTDNNPYAPPGERFKNMLSQIGDKYEHRRDELWNLRNDLMHNGLNPISFFAHTYMGHNEVLPIL
jgi:hypothetical protein